MLWMRDVRAGYEKVEVLRGVDIRVPDGCCVALIGPNGAGKTTLLRAVGGLLPVRSGRVMLRGEEIQNLGPADRSKRGICYVPETRGVWSSLTVRDNVGMFRGDREEEDALEVVGNTFPALSDKWDRLAGTLSGGEQQMLALVPAVLRRAEVLLVDEISTGLAPVVLDDLFEVLVELREEGCSMLLVEQYVERALEIAEFVYVMGKGEIKFVGEAEVAAEGAVYEEYMGSGHGV